MLQASAAPDSDSPREGHGHCQPEAETTAAGNGTNHRRSQSAQQSAAVPPVVTEFLRGERTVSQSQDMRPSHPDIPVEAESTVSTRVWSKK